jgi:hypothetical protein
LVFQNNENNKFSIQWQGKLALSYSGDYNFDYKFSTEIEIPEIYCPDISDQEIEALLSKYCIGSEKLKIVKDEEAIDEKSPSITTELELNNRVEANSSLWSKLKRLFN